MKPAKEWFEQLPEPVRSQAIANIIFDKDFFEDLSDTLFGAFAWEGTIQGGDYWHNIHSRCLRGEFAPKEPEQATPITTGVGDIIMIQNVTQDKMESLYTKHLEDMLACAEFMDKSGATVNKETRDEWVMKIKYLLSK